MNVIETLLTLVIWGAFSIVVLNRVDRELKISTPRTPPGLVAHMLWGCGCEHLPRQERFWYHSAYIGWNIILWALGATLGYQLGGVIKMAG